MRASFPYTAPTWPGGDSPLRRSISASTSRAGGTGKDGKEGAAMVERALSDVRRAAQRHLASSPTTVSAGVGRRARTGRSVENRDTGKFGNGFFEQLQPLPA